MQPALVHNDVEFWRGKTGPPISRIRSVPTPGLKKLNWSGLEDETNQRIFSTLGPRSGSSELKHRHGPFIHASERYEQFHFNELAWSPLGTR